MTDDSALLPIYDRMDFEPESGEGIYLYTDEAKTQRYMDFTSGIGVMAMGHSHPALVAALSDQGAKLWHTSNVARIKGLPELVKNLKQLSDLDGHAILCNDGTGANELALKMTRKFQHGTGHPERHRMISFDGCFHGRSLALIFASTKPYMVEGFGEPAVHYDHVPFGDLDAVKQAIGPETAGIIIEPIQGEGGIRVASPEFLRGLRELCDQNGLVLIFDEIQCGAGRTGKFFSYLDHDVRPDITTSAKGIGAGFPVAAVMASKRVSQFMTPGTHGGTYTGNPLAVRISQTAVDLITAPGLMDDVAEKGRFAIDQLKKLSHNFNDVVTNVTGKGLMIGLNVSVPNLEFRNRLFERRLWVAAAGKDGIRLLPPLTITRDELAAGIDIIRDVAHSFRP